MHQTQFSQKIPYGGFSQIRSHIWPDIAPTTEESRLQAMTEGTKSLTEMAPEDIRSNPDVNQSASSDLGARFTAVASIPEIPAHEYRQIIRGLNKTILYSHVS